MILESLVRYYEDLRALDVLPPPGWKTVKVSYALYLSEDGELKQVASLLEEREVGKKTVLFPSEMRLPAMMGRRTNGIEPNFLWDNSKYILGIDKDNIYSDKKSEERFRGAVSFHHKLLDDVNTPAARAILKFFDSWDPKEAHAHPALQDCLDNVVAGGNLVFYVNDRFAQEDEAIFDAWQKEYDKSDGPVMQCLVTGKEDVAIEVHPAISGVRGAQSSGAALVSFNAPAFCSYGKTQSLNAPVGKYATFAYTSALNYLLADFEHKFMLGDTTVLCWAEGGDPAYQEFAKAALFDTPQEDTEEGFNVYETVKRLAQGLPCEEQSLDPDRTFYILGIDPNAARLSVRFFYKDTFGALMKNINAHHERMEIVRPSFDPFETIPLWAMLRETVNLKSKDKNPNPVMAGATARAIFTGCLYPASLIESTMLRIRAERDISRGKAAIIKAYYSRNTHPDCPKEVLTVSLNETSTNIPYTLGRLFSVYEAIQERAIPGVKADIKSKFFNSASATPSLVFPVLANLSQKHLRKLKPGERIYFEKQIYALKGLLGEEYPVRFSMAQQGSFDLGYYHQTQRRYMKKEDIINECDQ